MTETQAIKEFTFLFRRYADRLYNHLLLSAGSREEAKTLMQQALMKMWMNPHTIDAEKAVASWKQGDDAGGYVRLSEIEKAEMLFAILGPEPRSHFVGRMTRALMMWKLWKRNFLRTWRAV